MLNKKKSLPELADQLRHMHLSRSSEYLKEMPLRYDSSIPVPPSKCIDPIMRADAIPFNPWCILAAVVISVVILLILEG